MRNVIFFDTSVWIDYFDADRNDHTKVMDLLNLCRRGNYLIATAASSVNDLHYLLQRCDKRAFRERGIKLSEEMALVIKEQATACVELLTEMATVVPVGHNEIRMARTLSKIHSDFEDNVIVATALKVKPIVFVTNDRDLVKHAPLPAMSTEDALAYLKALSGAAELG